ncbi:MAG: sigma-70 family RNA polymerase sigma factor [Ruminiclostridium sp.]|nr:sigma-70 family RNA polymerase sigma factor [Ruminiclostridium sp.]
MDDNAIIELFWQRSDNAIEETDKKYGAYCFAIADNILHSREDSEECVNDTYLNVWNCIPPQRPTRLRCFLARITRNLSFNRYNAKMSKKRGGGEMPLILDELRECIAVKNTTEEEFSAKELRKSLNSFVKALPQRDGNVFIRRYFFSESVAVIADKYALSENNVMVILSRTRKKLKEHLVKEGFVNE